MRFALRYAASLVVPLAVGCVQPEYPDDFEEIMQPQLGADASAPAPGLEAGLQPVLDSGAMPEPDEPEEVTPSGRDAAQGSTGGSEAGAPSGRPDASVPSEAGSPREGGTTPGIDASTGTGSGALASCSVTASTDANSAFLYRGKYGCAVWIGDASKKVVKAFIVATRIASRSGLSTYRTASTGATVDVVAGATLGAAKEHQYSWDVKGVSPGKYTLNVETHSSNGDVTVSVPFELGAQPVSAMGSAMGDIKAAAISCR